MARTLNQIQKWKDLAGQAHYNATELATHCEVSTRTLQRQFKETLGRSPHAWLNERRIWEAAHLLSEGASVKEVSSDLGFKHVSHFCRQFKAIMKMTPSQFVAAQTNVNRSFRAVALGDYSI